MSSGARHIKPEGCRFAGVRLLDMKANDQDKDLIIQQKQAMDKVSKKELSLLVQKSKSRSMNVCNAQTDNLTNWK